MMPNRKGKLIMKKQKISKQEAGAKGGKVGLTDETRHDRELIQSVLPAMEMLARAAKCRLDYESGLWGEMAFDSEVITDIERGSSVEVIGAVLDSVEGVQIALCKFIRQATACGIQLFKNDEARNGFVDRLRASYTNVEGLYWPVCLNPERAKLISEIA